MNLRIAQVSDSGAPPSTQMNLTLSEAVDRVRRWEKEASNIRGSLFASSQELQIAFLGSIHTEGNTIALTSDNGFKFHLTLTDAMTFRYGEPMLEIRAASWRCILNEPKD